jgi:DMSO/TMAO reductase YedYZ heme-binding membrane subunit
MWPAGYKWIVLPGIMGFFFGVGHFLAYLFFSQDIFHRFEKKFNSFLEESL